MEPDEKEIEKISGLPLFPLGDTKWRYIDEPPFLPPNILYRKVKPESHPFSQFIPHPSGRKQPRNKI